VAFTDAYVRGLKPQEGKRSAHYDGATPGLELRLSAGGQKTWGYRYRDAGGRTLRLVLGTFPAIGLKDAREAALQARAHVSRGGDPQTEKRVARAAARAQRIKTLKDLAESYLETAETKNRASSVAVDRQRIESHIIPKLGGQPVAAVTRAQVRELVSEIGKRGHEVTANRVAGIIVKLYRHARDDLDMTIQNPAAGLQSTYAEETRSRVLNDDELQKVWAALSGPQFAPLSEVMALCLKLTALTLQRGKEVSGIDLKELHLDQHIWIIPGERTKNGRDHVVPLSPQAEAVIRRALALRPKTKADKRKKAAITGPLFPSPRDPTISITRHALTRGMSRLCEEIGVKDVSPHDLRRTGSTAITSERIGMPRFVVSAVLNHTSEMGGITKIYDRNEYLPEKRRALEAWARVLRSIGAGKPKRRTSMKPTQKKT
jgi:integrase